MFALQSLGAIVVALFIDFSVALYAGLVLQSMWGWFIVPAFDVAGLSFMVATGLIVVASMLTMKTSIPKEQTTGEMMKEGFHKAYLKFIQISCFWFIAWAVVTVL